MGIIVGGPRCWKKRVKGDVVIAYHWVNHEPAMVLFPLRKSTGAGAFIIPHESSHLYATNTGGPTEHLIRMSFKAAEVMCMAPDRSMVKRIADAILDGLEDLVKMPPEPNWGDGSDKVVGHVKLMQGGQTVVDGEVTAGALAGNG